MDGAFEYLKGKIIKDPKDPNVVAMTCEALSRAILTAFNHDQYAAFPEEGNSLLGEFRLYRSPSLEKKHRGKPLEEQIDAQGRQVFEAFSNAGIVKRITGKIAEERKLHRDDTEQEIEKRIRDRYDLRIRVVDNEGSRVQKVVKALHLLNDLLGSKSGLHGDFAENKRRIKEYNSKYKVGKIDITESSEDITFFAHIARHLLNVFDFMPLGKEVFAPKLGKNTIKVYKYADGEKSAQYLIQEGRGYREEKVNGAGLYNKKTIFRSEMSNDDTKDVLCKKIVSHVILSLIPFTLIRARVEALDEGTQAGGTRVLKAFLEMVVSEYKNEGYDFLDLAWKEGVISKYVSMTKPSSKLDDSTASSIADEQTYADILSK
ncbi:MAG: hypothetical protein QWI36_04590 [Wolbachia endosymbiont of Tyrophagus putrescentiae]|nr:hypothetical protein [Wolbachia endosymbiont of Tyrophagus putrescentiae]